LAKIALELEQALAERARNGAPGSATGRLLARGEGWSVEDVVCTSSRQDRPFEERHGCYRIAMVVAGSFEYLSVTGRELMTPGSLLLGNAGQGFECAHDHAAGDRCLSFGYTPEFFEHLAAEAGVRPGFGIPRLPPLRDLATVVARGCAGLTGPHAPWEEIAIRLAAQTARLARGLSPDSRSAPPSAVARVTRVVRLIERHPDSALTLGALAAEARLSPYHFLRTFEGLTGLTPHQYLLRSRLREAAARLAGEPGKILEIAFDCGFGDVSNFNRAFRAEFGASPRAFRRHFPG
jgi:AraC-like DNA-binding protein